VISSVYYVLELKNNLLSIRQLQEKGLSILIQHRKCSVYHPEKGLIEWFLCWLIWYQQLLQLPHVFRLYQKTNLIFGIFDLVS